MLSQHLITYVPSAFLEFIRFYRIVSLLIVLNMIFRCTVPVVDIPTYVIGLYCFIGLLPLFSFSTKYLHQILFNDTP